ncbi:MAG TPA: hypothetical protein PLH46_00890 [Caldisericia bacterium]|nr:hypothetical protein [Caldisericia bacterium]
MECILKFNLPEEKEEMELALKAMNYYSFVEDLDDKLRIWLKHGQHDFKTPEDVMEFIRELIVEYNLLD